MKNIKKLTSLIRGSLRLLANLIEKITNIMLGPEKEKLFLKDPTVYNTSRFLVGVTITVVLIILAPKLLKALVWILDKTIVFIKVVVWVLDLFLKALRWVFRIK